MQIKPPNDVDKIANTALSEDIGSGDITALLIDPKAEATAEIIVKETGIICGIPYAESAFRQLQSQNFLSLEWLFNDGDEESARTQIFHDLAQRSYLSHLLIW